jgi:hypothetical protein
VWALAILATSCATAQSRLGMDAGPSRAASDPATHAEASLRTRVSEYWALRQARNLVGIYPYYSSQYRARVSRDEFVKQTRLVRFELSDAVVAGVAMSGTRADVTVAYRLVMPTLGTEPLRSTSVETWITEPDGQWYRLDEPLQLPFPPGGGLATEAR